MTKHRLINAETMQEKRRLRAEIGRDRIRLQSTLAALAAEKRRLTSWRTYVDRFPLAILASSFGAGLLMAVGRPAPRIPKSLASGLLRWGLTAVRTGVLSDLVGVFNAVRQSRRGGPNDGM